MLIKKIQNNQSEGSKARSSHGACRLKLYAKLLLALVLVATELVSAQVRSNIVNPDLEPRGPAEATICTQNLENYGLYETAVQKGSNAKTDFQFKQDALVQRFATNSCDIILVQEVAAPNEYEATRVLQQLADALKRRTNRQYDVKTAESNDRFLRLGFIVAKDRAEILNSTSYSRVELPKISKKDKPVLFTRGPLEIQLKVYGKQGSEAKNLVLVNMHFKSKVAGSGDPAGLEWEPLRMQMAEALRRVIEKRHSENFSSANTLLILAGDRNSNFDSASANILNGTLRLKEFGAEGKCRLSKNGLPLCKQGAATQQQLFSVLTSDPETKLNPGTYRYEKVYSWLDDIIMPAETLRFAWAEATSEGNYNSGVVYEPRDASDHAMAWVRLNWG